MKSRPLALLLLLPALPLTITHSALAAPPVAGASAKTEKPSATPSALPTLPPPPSSPVSSPASSPHDTATLPHSPADENAAPTWDYTSLAEWRRIPAEEPIKSVAISPDGKIIAGGGDGKVYLWNDAGELLSTIITEPQLMPDLPKAKPEDDLLGQKRAAPPSAEKWVRLLVFSPDGKLLATAGPDSTVKLWNMDNSQWIRTFAGHQDAVTSIIFTPDSRAIATGSMDKNIKLWNTANGQLLGTLSQHVYPVRSVAFSKDLNTLISIGAQGAGRKNGELKFWDIAGKGDLKEEMTIDGIAPESAQLLADGRILASGADFRRPAVKLWDAQTGKLVRNTVPGYASGVGISTLAFTSDFSVVAGGGVRTGKHAAVWVWEVRNGKMLKIIQTSTQNGVVFSPDGRVLAVAGEDKSVQLWRVP